MKMLVWEVPGIRFAHPRAFDNRKRPMLSAAKRRERSETSGANSSNTRK